MKISRYIKAMTLCIAVATMLASCDKDGDFLTTSGGDDVTLDGTTSDIVLDYSHLNALALTVYWNENGDISLSNPLVAAPGYAVDNTIQFSADEDFTSTNDLLMGKGVFERQFTVGELNNILGKLGFAGGVKAPLYIRVKSVLGDNLAPRYSNVLVVNVTPYVIDMTVGKILSSSLDETGKTLYSPEGNSVYSGFVGAGAWENWWLREGDGTTWGNVGDDGGGTPFVISSNDQAWNFWYPGQSGCYYTVLDVAANEWSALFIPSLTVSGDISGEMTYDRKANKWMLTFNAATSGTKNITISGTGKQYNVSTSTDDAAAISTPVAFGGTSDALTFGQSASTIAVAVGATGESTLTIDLNDPKAWTAVVTSGGGSTGGDEVKPLLYVSGIDDAWATPTDYFLRLYNEDNLTYGGALNISSQWGYRLYPDNDWSSFYTMVDGGNAYEGKLTLVGESNTNIAAPTAGLYVMDVSLSALTYKLYAVSTVSYAGLNDNWDLAPMTATSTPGVYTADVVKSANTPYGVKIYINDSWDLWFGGSNGELKLFVDGFTGDNELANGNYLLTVDLCNGTYSYTAK